MLIRSDIVFHKLFERKIVNVFLPINLNICFVCSKELSHRDSSFEYPKHTFCLRNKKFYFNLHTLIWRAGYSCILYNFRILEFSKRMLL